MQTSSPLKPAVRIDNNLEEIVTWGLSTNMAEMNLIHQKTWPPGAWPVSVVFLCKKLKSSFLKPAVEIEIFAEIVTR